MSAVYLPPMNVVWVALGGGLGSALRYLADLAVRQRFGEGPYGTFTVNVIGSFALAILWAGAAKGTVSPELRIALGTGVLGGFTTYSTFNHDVLRFAESGAMGSAAAYLTATVVICLGAGLAGQLVGRAVFG